MLARRYTAINPDIEKKQRRTIEQEKHERLTTRLRNGVVVSRIYGIVQGHCKIQKNFLYICGIYNSQYKKILHDFYIWTYIFQL